MEGKMLTQYCLDSQYVLETLKSLPNDVKVETLRFRIGTSHKSKRLTIPNKLSRLGVRYYRTSVPKLEAIGHFVSMTRTKMKEFIHNIAQEMGDTDVQKACVETMTVSHKGVNASFARVKKEIRPDDTDQRKKLHVLGLTTHEGNLVDLLKALSLTKYACKIDIRPTRVITCSVATKE